MNSELTKFKGSANSKYEEKIIKISA